jgi:hypothetical protein
VLVDQDLAARLLAGTLSEQHSVPNRTRDVFVCRASETGNRLLVLGCGRERAVKRFQKIGRRANALAGVGDESLSLRDQVAGGRIAVGRRQGPWLVDLTVVARDAKHTVDEAALIARARTAIARLAGVTFDEPAT